MGGGNRGKCSIQGPPPFQHRVIPHEGSPLTHHQVSKETSHEGRKPLEVVSGAAFCTKIFQAFVMSRIPCFTGGGVKSRAGQHWGSADNYNQEAKDLGQLSQRQHMSTTSSNELPCGNGGHHNATSPLADCLLTITAMMTCWHWWQE